jgi:hypothetical protein
MEFLVFWQTDKAVHVGFSPDASDDEKYWLPKSQIDFDRSELKQAVKEKGICDIEVPDWLLDAKGIDPDTELQAPSPKKKRKKKDEPSRKVSDKKPIPKSSSEPDPLVQQLEGIAEASAEFLSTMSDDETEVSAKAAHLANKLIGLLKDAGFISPR